MEHSTNKICTAFLGPELVASGTLSQLAVALRKRLKKKSNDMPLVFDDHTGNPIELDLRGTAAQVEARYADSAPADPPETSEDHPPAPGRGRPRLGVIAREVTLLPEHWDWLASQPGGASVALRKLVHTARQANLERDQKRQAHERAYKVMSALAGNLPGFEESSRALFAGELDRMARLAKAWPADIRNYILRLATVEPAAATR